MQNLDAKRIYRVNSIKIAVFCTLYEIFHETDNKGRIDQPELWKSRFPHVSRNVLDSAIELLERERNVVKDRGTLLGGMEPIRISSDGVEYIEQFMENEESDYYKYLTLSSEDRVNYGIIGPVLKINKREIHENQIDMNPPADQWEPLDLERGGEREKRAVDATEQLIERVRGDNGYSLQNPVQQNSIITSITSGLDVLNRGMPTRYVVNTLILNPIKFLSEKFSSSAIGELAKIALKNFLDWLG